MDHDKPEDELSLTAQSPRQLSVRASLISRGLQNIFDDEHIDIYSWLANLPHGSTLVSLTFRDGTELPIDDRDTSSWRKHSSQMSQEEIWRELTEDRCSGLPSSRTFREDIEEKTYAYRGYIEIEGVHPFERSTNLVDANEKEMLLSAIGVLLRRLLAQNGSVRLYCDGDTLLEFLAGNLNDVQTFIEQMNSQLRATVVTIRRPDGTNAKRQSGLGLELTEYHHFVR